MADEPTTLKAPPHLDHWSTALVWLVSEFCRVEGLDAPRIGHSEFSYEPGDMAFAMAHRALIRMHPLYERFIAANAITEEELVTMLVDKAQGSVVAKKELANLPPANVVVCGLPPTIEGKEFLDYVARIFPAHFHVTLGGQS